MLHTSCLQSSSNKVIRLRTRVLRDLDGRRSQYLACRRKRYLAMSISIPHQPILARCSSAMRYTEIVGRELEKHTIKRPRKQQCDRLAMGNTVHPWSRAAGGMQTVMSLLCIVLEHKLHCRLNIRRICGWRPSVPLFRLMDVIRSLYLAAGCTHCFGAGDVRFCSVQEACTSFTTRHTSLLLKSF